MPNKVVFEFIGNPRSILSAVKQTRKGFSDLGKEQTKFNDKLRRQGENFQQYGGQIRNVGLALTAAITLPLALFAKGSVDAARAFETSFTGVRKTVDATEAEFASLSAGFRQMAKDIPIAVDELNGIGEAAGQLGIKTENILGFTKTVAQLAVTTNLTADAAANALARIANITGLQQDQFDRLGAAIVDLGNNFAVTESEIVEFGLRIAGAGKIAGLTEAEILAIGAAMASIGVPAESGGTAVQKTLNDMTQAVANGGAKLEVFAETAGMTAQEFATAFREDGAGAFKAFVEGIGRQGEGAFKTLEALGLNGQRVTRSLIGLGQAGDLLGRAFDRGNAAFAENTALAKEATLRFGTFDSKMQLFGNTVQDIKITLGQQLLPVLISMLDGVRPLVDLFAKLANRFAEASTFTKTMVIGMTAIVAVLPVLLLIGGQVVVMIGSMTVAAAALNISVGTLATTMAVATGGLTLLAAAAVGLIGAWLSTKTAGDQAASTVVDIAKEITILNKEILKLDETDANYTQRLNNLTTALDERTASLRMQNKALGDQVALARPRIEALEEELELAKKLGGHDGRNKRKRIRDEIEDLKELITVYEETSEALATQTEAVDDLEVSNEVLTESQIAMNEAISQLVERFGGSASLSAAKAWKAAVEDIGGVTKLTKADQEEYTKVLDTLIETYEALGKDVPKWATDQKRALEDLADESEETLDIVKAAAIEQAQVRQKSAEDSLAAEIRSLERSGAKAGEITNLKLSLLRLQTAGVLAGLRQEYDAQVAGLRKEGLLTKENLDAIRRTYQEKVRHVLQLTDDEKEGIIDSVGDYTDFVKAAVTEASEIRERMAVSAMAAEIDALERSGAAAEEVTAKKIALLEMMTSVQKTELKEWFDEEIGLLDDTVDGYQEAYDALVALYNQKVDQVLADSKREHDGIVEDGETATTGVATTWQDAARSIAGSIGGALDQVYQVVSNMAKALAEGDVLGAIIAAAVALKDAFIAVFQDMFSGAQMALNDIKDAFKEMHKDIIDGLVSIDAAMKIAFTSKRTWWGGHDREGTKEAQDEAAAHYKYMDDLATTFLEAGLGHEEALAWERRRIAATSAEELREIYEELYEVGLQGRANVLLLGKAAGSVIRDFEQLNEAWGHINTTGQLTAEATERYAKAMWEAREAGIELTEGQNQMADAYGRTIEAKERLAKLEELESLDRKIRLREIQDQIDAIEEERDAELKAIDDRIRAHRKERDEILSGFDDQISASEEARDAELKSIDDQIDALNDLMAARRKANSEALEAARQKVIDVGATSGIAGRLGIDITEAQQFGEQEASDRIIALAEDIAILQKAGVKAEDLDTAEFRDELSIAIEGAKRFGVTVPESLRGLVSTFPNIIGGTVRFGDGLTDAARRVQSLAEERERIEREANQKLETLRANRAATEERFDAELSALAAERKETEERFITEIQLMLDNRAEIEQEYNDRLQELRDARELIEQETIETLEEMRSRREELEGELNVSVGNIGSAIESAKDAIDSLAQWAIDFAAGSGTTTPTETGSGSGTTTPTPPETTEVTGGRDGGSGNYGSPPLIGNPDDPRGYSFQSGSKGFRDFGAGSRVKLHGLEEVLTARQGAGVADMVATALQPVVGMFGDRQAASSQSVTVRVPLIVSSRELAEVIIPVLPDLLREMRLA